MTAGDAKIKAVVVGATGYSGGELVSILSRHPRVRLAGLFGSSRSAAAADDRPHRIADFFPRLRNRVDLEVWPADIDRLRSLSADAVFLATPHEASLQFVGQLNASPAIFDLSGAFRLKPASLYPRYYGFEHAHPELLERAVYGLAELNRAAIAAANLIAVPGCYPTSAILPLAPLAQAGAIRTDRPPVIDSTSGVSGAGRTPTAKTTFCEVSLQPYNVLAHRHGPEIDLHAGVRTIFTPHLGAFDRGILSTIHADLAPGWNAQRIDETLHAVYENERFIRLLPAGQWPSIAAVRSTNCCDIGWAVDEELRHLIIVTAIDNLVKGAAGQAVQCMNIRFDFPEALALEGETC